MSTAKQGMSTRSVFKSKRTGIEAFAPKQRAEAKLQARLFWRERPAGNGRFAFVRRRGARPWRLN
jgi:hypothetical protein